MKIIILNLDLERDSFLRDGAFLKQTYKISLQRVGNDETD